MRRDRFCGIRPESGRGGTSGSIVCRFVRRIFDTNFYETFSASYFARARCRNARRTAVPEVFEKIGRFGTADPKGAPVAESVAFVNAGDEPLVVLKVASLANACRRNSPRGRHARRHGRADRYVQSARTAIGRLPESLEGIRQYAGKNAHFDGAKARSGRSSAERVLLLRMTGSSPLVSAGGRPLSYMGKIWTY